MKTSKFLKLIPFAALAVLALTSCSGGANAETTQTVVEKPKVKLESVKSQAVDQNYEFTATVEANIKNNIAPSMSVRIEKIYAEVGDQVRKGQKLVQMDNANVKQAKTQLDNLDIEFKRVDELYKIGGVSKSEWDARKTAYEVAKTSYQNLVENTQLLSPINGVITARNYDNGDMYSSSNNPVLTVEQITPVKVMINVSESFFTYVKKGMGVKIKADVYGDQEFDGKVSLVYPTVDAQTRTFPVEITIANGNQKIRPGMFARVNMSFGVLDHVVAPDLSVIKQAGSGDRYIYVYKDGKVTYNKVMLGRRMGNTYEVISGVNDGDQVVVTGQSRLNNGMEVEIVK